MSFRSIIVALCICSICSLLPEVVFARKMIGFQGKSDTKTLFIWSGAKTNPGKEIYIILDKEGNGVVGNFDNEIDVEFAKADVNKIRWCSYIGTDINYKGCTPDKMLKPSGKITIK